MARKRVKRGWRIDGLSEALAYVQASFNTIVVAYSGGKDSTASLLWCKETFPGKSILGLLADTGIEAPGTKEYVKSVERITGIPITWCDDPVSLRDGTVVRDVFDVARRSGRFPLPGACDWRSLLKTERVRRWLRAQGLDRPVLVMGQRWEESPHRSRLPYFSGGEGWRNGAEIFRPILAWKEREVMAYVRERGISLHPAYELGFRRLSCMPCVMAPVGDLELLARVYPERIKCMVDLEEELGMRFHPRYSVSCFLAAPDAARATRKRLPDAAV